MKYFGTDGIRGAYGGPVMNEDFVASLGSAAAAWLRTAGGAEGAGRQVVLVGRDTRFSGPALEQALAGGLAGGGLLPVSLGVLPTPAVSRAVRRQKAALGVVITASHNPAGDNGIKFFRRDGTKLSEADEAAIEARLLPGKDRAAAPARGNQPGEGDAVDDYIAAAMALLPGGALKGWRIVLDTANGATCGTSPLVLRNLGAEIIAIGNAPDGRNINASVGSEHPALLAKEVRAAGARLGIAHDGDGDRCILSDEMGIVLDGDEILAILGTDALERGRLPGKCLVATVQSNLGLDAALAAAGGSVVRTPVGDRNVAEQMTARGAILGGESSGHIICAEICPTGDGLVAALKVIEVMRRKESPLSELRKVLRKFPQRSLALSVREKKPLESLSALPAAIAALERELGARGRVLVRYSGTESKLRILVEGPTDDAVESGLALLAAAARQELGSG